MIGVNCELWGINDREVKRRVIAVSDAAWSLARADDADADTRDKKAPSLALAYGLRDARLSVQAYLAEESLPEWSDTW